MWPRRLNRTGGEAVAIQADAADAVAVQAAVETTVTAFGQPDVFVNNAGSAPIPKIFEESTLEEMDRVMDINIRAHNGRNAGGAQAHEERRPIIMIGSRVGERV
jgi:3-oxoacyl-[acyl-carrier protein] reductase